MKGKFEDVKKIPTHVLFEATLIAEKTKIPYDPARLQAIVEELNRRGKEGRL